MMLGAEGTESGAGVEVVDCAATVPLNTLITTFVVLVISRSHKVALGFAIGLAIQPILDM